MKTTFTILLLVLLNQVKAQNLVHNPSFEQSTACPTDTNQIAFASEWFPAGAGADYYDSCCSNCSVDIPLNLKGYQLAYSGGHAYAGILTYSESKPNSRGYIHGTLDPLTIGHWYRIKIHLTSSSQVKYGTRAPAAFFFINQTIPANDQVLPFTPQADFFPPYVGDDTTNWINLKRIVYADSAYTNLLIGNFYDDASSILGTNNFLYPLTPEARIAYIFLDEITVIDITAAYLAGLETEQQTVTAYPNPFTEHTTLSFANPQAQPHTLTIYNMQGIAVREINNITGSEVILQRDGLPAAYYFYRLSGTAGTMATGKLLIQ